MSERIKRTVGAVCLCCHIHDRTAKGMQDSDWLEVVGNPTIPHVQSLRQPPASVALPVSKEKLIGLTTKNASKRYLQKLQKERERNHEVLTECVDNLPIVIRQLAYPESPPHKTPFRCSHSNAVHSAEKKFRVGKIKDDYWQENSEQWTKEDAEKEKENSPRIARKTKNIEPVTQELHNHDTGEPGVTGEYVHHAGFAGVPNQTSALKHRFGKKKANIVSESAESGLPKNTFRPKGFGALYDEMEFERRYKKVFDLNKHIHFVHSNFVSGQRISKRAKLPPIGHNPSVFSDPAEGGDIFAIMSVQKYNYPEYVDPSVSKIPSASNRHVKQDGPSKRHRAKRPLEIPREVDVPIGFVPGTITKTGQSPFNGVQSTPVSVEQFEDSLEHSRDHSVAFYETQDSISQTERSMTSVSNRSRHAHEDKKTRTNKKRTAKKQEHEPLTETRSDEESEPFNISVHVELKPKGSTLSIEDEEDTHNKSSRKIKNGRYSNQSPHRNISDHRKEYTHHNDPHISDRSDCEHDLYKERIIYPTPVSTCDTETRDSSDLDSPGRVIKPKNMTISTSPFGVTHQKVKYPERFVLNESIAEYSLSGSEHSANSFPASRQYKKTKS